ncbi:MAG: hypothetical protein H6502_04165 [Candidatus Woesearchaeota archaeon]|nr:MAG: hypothetical protein H6502_04165 [Candidatus Woesearchaeota archaeon]
MAEDKNADPTLSVRVHLAEGYCFQNNGRGPEVVPTRRPGDFQYERSFEGGLSQLCYSFGPKSVLTSVPSAEQLVLAAADEGAHYTFVVDGKPMTLRGTQVRKLDVQGW